MATYQWIKGRMLRDCRLHLLDWAALVEEEGKMHGNVRQELGRKRMTNGTTFLSLMWQVCQ